MAVTVDTTLIRQQVRAVVDPMFLALRETLYGSGISYNTHISSAIIPPDVTTEDNLNDRAEALGFIKHIPIYSGSSFIINAKELAFNGATITTAGNRAIVTITAASGGGGAGSGLSWSGLTVGQVYRATSDTTAEFGALDLSNINATVNILARSRGGLGINANSTGPGFIKQLTAGGSFSVAPVEWDEIDYTTVSGPNLSVLHVDSSAPVFREIDMSGVATALTNALPAQFGGTNVENDPGAFLIIPDAGGTAALLEEINTFTGTNNIFNNYIRVNGINLGQVASSDWVMRHNTASTGTIFRVSPNGNGLTNPAILQMFNTDWTADQTNFELFSVGWNSNLISFLSQKGGTGTLRDMRFAAGSAMTLSATGNLGIFGTSYGASSVGVIAIANRTTAPTGNPTAGYVLYAESGALKGRGTSGTVTTIGNADPHCPRCKKDYALEWDNATWGHFAICIPCLVKELEKAGVSLSKYRIKR